MRNLVKRPCPQTLADNAAAWTTAYVQDPNNSTKKYRYRDPSIKATLVQETSSKCAYCESKIGHNTPGDVEHKVPSSVDRNRHYDWNNLTIACTECNRRKDAYYSAIKPFLDPYVDDVETRVIHHGPIASWMPGDATAEITIRTLQIHDDTRKELITRKIEKIDELNNVLARMTEDQLMRDLMLIKIEKMKSVSAEYSAMIKSICDIYNIA